MKLTKTTYTVGLVISCGLDYTHGEDYIEADTNGLPQNILNVLSQYAYDPEKQTKRLPREYNKRQAAPPEKKVVKIEALMPEPKKPFVRPKGEYSNPQYHELYK